jgi:hypothetical protein
MTASTPDHSIDNEPTTPARNPASIDRRGLVGVGELATPRWARSEREHGSRHDDTEHLSFLVGVEADMPEDAPDPESDIWSLNAIESEGNEHDVVMCILPDLCISSDDSLSRLPSNLLQNLSAAVAQQRTKAEAKKFFILEILPLVLSVLPN